MNFYRIRHFTLEATFVADVLFFTCNQYHELVQRQFTFESCVHFNYKMTCLYSSGTSFFSISGEKLVGIRYHQFIVIPQVSSAFSLHHFLDPISSSSPAGGHHRLIIHTILCIFRHTEMKNIEQIFYEICF